MGRLNAVPARVYVEVGVLGGPAPDRFYLPADGSPAPWGGKLVGISVGAKYYELCKAIESGDMLVFRDGALYINDERCSLTPLEQLGEAAEE